MSTYNLPPKRNPRANSLCKQVVECDNRDKQVGIFILRQRGTADISKVERQRGVTVLHGFHPLRKGACILFRNGKRGAAELHLTEVYHIVGPLYEKVNLHSVFLVVAFHHVGRFYRFHAADVECSFHLGNVGETSLFKGYATPCRNITLLESAWVMPFVSLKCSQNQQKESTSL